MEYACGLYIFYICLNASISYRVVKITVISIIIVSFMLDLVTCYKMST